MSSQEKASVSAGKRDLPAEMSFVFDEILPGKNLLRDHRLAADGGLAGLPEDLESDIKLARGVHSRALGNPAGDHDLLEEVVDTADEFGLII